MIRLAIVAAGVALLLLADLLIHRRKHRSRIDRLKRVVTTKGE